MRPAPEGERNDGRNGGRKERKRGREREGKKGSERGTAWNSPPEQKTHVSLMKPDTKSEPVEKGKKKKRKTLVRENYGTKKI